MIPQAFFYHGGHAHLWADIPTTVAVGAAYGTGGRIAVTLDLERIMSTLDA
jgi:hypothetical protein